MKEKRRTITDKKLMQWARELDKPVHAPMLWNRIENAMREEQSRKLRHNQKQQRPAIAIFMKIAAVFVLAIGLGSIAYMAWFQESQSQNLLTEKALQQVLATEAQYVEAISELEQHAHDELPKMDMELALLYRDRLETIDAQIARCRQALAENPANTHIRRYLLAALQDKRETLAELTIIIDN